MMTETAKMHLKNTFDSAFTKTKGTKKQRIALAHRAVRMVPCNDITLTLWAVEYCSEWKAPN
jgi:hypothetical protein